MTRRTISFSTASKAFASAAVWAAARPLGPRAATVAAVLAGTCGWFVYLSGVAYVENALLLPGRTASVIRR